MERVNGIEFSSDTLRWIQELADSEPQLSRRELARRVCQRLNWRRRNGRFATMSCCKALYTLQERGRLRLPQATRPASLSRSDRGLSSQAASERSCCPSAEPSAVVECSLSELGEVELRRVGRNGSRTSQVWNELMDRFHPLGRGPLRGERLRYLIHSDRFGWLGGLAFSASVWKLRARDRWIGWSEAARRAHLHSVVNNSRFLILPSVRVRNLASFVLARALDQLPEDWEERFGHRPVLVETFVNPKQYRGTCYRAAGWEEIGLTRARPTPFPNGRRADGPKRIFVKPLVPDWRERLCEEPTSSLGERVVEGDSWEQEEFGAAEFFDPRLTRRLQRLARRFFDSPGALIPQACKGDPAEIKAAYRFFHNPRCTMETILQAHREAVVERLRRRPDPEVLLAVQDTTSLNYAACESLNDQIGPIGRTDQKKARGLYLHSTLLTDTSGVPLGLLDVHGWTRDGFNETPKNRPDIPIEQKETFRWIESYRRTAEFQALFPNKTFVSVGDREADIYELFAEAACDPDGPQLLVRLGDLHRRVLLENTSQELKQYMKSRPVLGTFTMDAPVKSDEADDRRAGKRREVKMSLRLARVALRPPCKKKGLPTVQVWVVLVEEIDPPSDVEEPLSWMLLTTVPTETFEEALERTRWYALRWGIEVFHRILKYCLRVEDYRFRDLEALWPCVALDMVNAWRIFALTKQGRETPDIPCDVYLTEEEYVVLHLHMTGRAPDGPYALGLAVRWIAMLGGYVRTSKTPPGPTVVARGLDELAAMVKGFRAARLLQNLPPP